MTETTSPAPLEPTDAQRAEAQFYAMLRDQFAAAALPALLELAVQRRIDGGKVMTVNGQSGGQTTHVGYVPDLVEWACDSAFQIADRMIAARHGSLPRQLARLKAMADAADKEASPAAPLLKGPGAA